MKIVTRETLAAVAADRWAATYKSSNFGADKLEKLEKLRKLGGKPNPDDVDRVIGNSTWTDIGPCRECRENVKEVIEIGRIYICKPCLVAASKL